MTSLGSGWILRKKKKKWVFPKFENALIFLFLKVGSSAFQVFFVSSWNVHFRWKSMFSYLGRSCTPTTKTSIFTKIIFFWFSPKNHDSENPCFSGGWVYMTSRDRKTWIFTGNGRFRTRQKKPEKRSSQLWETKKWEHFQIWGKLTFSFFFSKSNPIRGMSCYHMTRTSELQIFSSKKVRVFCWSSQICQDWTFLTNPSSDHWIWLWLPFLP